MQRRGDRLEDYKRVNDDDRVSKQLNWQRKSAKEMEKQQEEMYQRHQAAKKSLEMDVYAVQQQQMKDHEQENSFRQKQVEADKMMRQTMGERFKMIEKEELDQKKQKKNLYSQALELQMNQHKTDAPDPFKVNNRDIGLPISHLQSDHTTQNYMIPGFYDNSQGVDARAYKRKGAQDPSYRQAYNFGTIGRQLLSPTQTNRGEKKFKQRNSSMPTFASQDAIDLSRHRHSGAQYNPITNPIPNYESPEMFNRKAGVFKNTSMLNNLV